MDTTTLKKFAQAARRQLLEQVAARLEQVLRSDSVEIREKAKVVVELKTQIEASSKQKVIDRVAYTWFNRFCALRFMDVNHYTRIGVVSPVEDFTQPEILQEAKQGHIDEELQSFVEKQTIFDLLNGKRPSSDPQQEAYRLLLVGISNSFNEIMPFMFEKIEDYTELLMPLDLLSENSVLYELREALTPEACQDVEVIGWLYQYYISERKDEVFEALKQNKKIEAQDIPAATQLFTPDWIVRYLVENSLGRLWMLNHPDSRLTNKMEYYIKPEQTKTDFLKITNPEELKICDPACGSGHMLTYAFDLLFAIYEEEGYPAAEIPRMILEKNLFGIEIDPRAGALSAFAVFMKARSKDRRFFTRPTQPNICVLENVTFTDVELNTYTKTVGRDLFTTPLLETLNQFEQADNFGSLIRPKLIDAGYVRGILERKDLGGDLFLYSVHERVLKALKQIEYLAPRYHVVVANPPFMGAGGMNDDLKSFLSNNYKDVKSDIFSSFMVRNFSLTLSMGYLGYVTPFVWMFLSSYEKLRKLIISEKGICNLVKPSYTSFFASAIVPLVTFVIVNSQDNLQGDYFDLGFLGSAESQPLKLKEAIQNPDCGWHYRCFASDFKKIPGSPIAYHMSEKVRKVFTYTKSLENIAEPRKGLSTGDNDQFLRLWPEVRKSTISLYGGTKWYPMTKGGNFRKWYGNNEYLILWENNGEKLKTFPGSVIRNEKYYLRQGGSWNGITSYKFSMRYTPAGFINNAAGPMVYAKNIIEIIAMLNSSVANHILSLLFPTMNYEVGSVASFPAVEYPETQPLLAEKIIQLSKFDWDEHETSWDFQFSPLAENKKQLKSIKETYNSLRKRWAETMVIMHQLENENNRIFIEAYGLQGEINENVLLKDVTLLCNPNFRYGDDRSNDELERFFKSDTLKEFISYAVGCMFGRYSLDKPGLILANQGEIMKDYLKQIPKPIFMPDEDNVIPVLESEWFKDDISERFKKFVRVSFGEEHYEENLAFIEEAIERDIRSYFTKEFYKDHVQMYKKRPIYWMFSSPKGSFNALIYMHRYQPDTVSIVLDGYLREYVKKLTSHKSQLEVVSVSANSSQSHKTKALREITQINKVLAEMKEYEREIFALASQKIKIDLDDGVKVNYNKFGSALSYIPGLSQ